MLCLLGAEALWLGLPSVAGAQVGAAPPSTDEVILVHVCDDGMPEGWEVIEQGSSLGERVVVCNFTAAVSGDAVKAFDSLPSNITLFAPEDSVNGLPENINMQAAGVAITVEYYCTAAEAADRWEGLSGSQRDTEVPGTRTPDRVVLEEGRIASTEKGRERGLVESIFMPGLFTLQEKSFLLLNEQTVATVVINTNSREISVRTSANEPGIADNLARTVSANHTPAATPECNIPAVARPVGDPSTGGQSRGRAWR